MKRLLIILPAAALMAAACGKIPGPAAAAPEGELTVSLTGLWDTAGTKATPGNADENKLNKLTLYVFDAAGMLDVSHACTSAEIAAQQVKLRTKTGRKTICAVANMSAAMQVQADTKYRLADLDAIPYELADNSPTGFVMRGVSGDVSVSSGSGGSATVSLVRGVARVSLESVKNNLPAPFGTVKLRHAFLCNVVGNQNIGGVADADPQKYINREATRGHVRNQVIGTGSVEAECKDLTFKTLGQDVAHGDTQSLQNSRFYAFPNPLTTPNNGFNENFTPTATVLMVVVSVKGTDYYYPVPLRNGLVANTEYKVELTLAGLGNTEEDPFARIDKGDLTATISVSPWNNGATITETI